MIARVPPGAKLTRTELLCELGLSPLWRLRGQPVRAGATAGVHEVAVKPSLVQGPLAAGAGVAPAASTPVVAAALGRSEEIAAMDWQALRQSVAACRACALCQERRQAVLGVGDRAADWLFIGEAPGAEEDARGEPFVGPAGQLLDAMLAAIELRRGSDVYIANAVKCRPPNNRTPEGAEIERCAPYLRRQIALLQPRLIVLLGRAAVNALLGDIGSLASLRGRSLEYRGPEAAARAIPVLVTYHPAYLLRTLTDKAKAWEDLCRARALMRAAKASAATTAARGSAEPA